MEGVIGSMHPQPHSQSPSLPQTPTQTQTQPRSPSPSATSQSRHRLNRSRSKGSKVSNTLCRKLLCSVGSHAEFGGAQRALFHLHHLNKRCDQLPNSVTVLSVITEDGSVLDPSSRALSRCIIVASTEIAYVYHKYSLIVALDLSASMFSVTQLRAMEPKSAYTSALDFALPVDQLVPILRAVFKALFHPSKRKMKDLPFQPRIDLSVIAYSTPAVHVVSHQIQLTSDSVCTVLDQVKEKLRGIEAKTGGETGANLDLVPFVQSVIVAAEAHSPENCPLVLVLTDGVWESAKRSEALFLRLGRRDIPCHVAHIRGPGQAVLERNAFATVANVTQVKLLTKVTNGAFVKLRQLRQVFVEENRLAATKICLKLLTRRSLGKVGVGPEGSEMVEQEQKQWGQEDTMVIHEVMDYVVQGVVKLEALVKCRIKEGFILCQILTDDMRKCVRLSLHWSTDVIVHYIVKCTNHPDEDPRLVVRVRLKARAEMMDSFFALGRTLTSELTDEESKVCLRLHRFINAIQETDRVGIFLAKLPEDHIDPPSLQLESDDAAAHTHGEHKLVREIDEDPRTLKAFERTLLVFASEEVKRWNRWLDLSTYDLICPHAGAHEEISAAVIKVSQIHAFSADHRTLCTLSTLPSNSMCFLRIRFLTEYLATIHIACTLSTPLEDRRTVQEDLLKRIRLPPVTLEFEEVETLEEGSVKESSAVVSDYVGNYVTSKRLRRLAYPSLHGFLDEFSAGGLLAAFSTCKRWEYGVPDKLSGKEAMRHLINSRICEGFLVVASSFEIGALRHRTAAKDLVRMGSKDSRNSSSLQMDENPRVSFCRLFQTSDGKECLVQYCLSLSDTNALAIYCWIEHTGSTIMLGKSTPALSVEAFFQLLIEHFTNIDRCLICASVEFMRIQAAATTVWDVLFEENKEEDKEEATPQAHLGIASLVELSSTNNTSLQLFKQLGNDTASQANVYLYDRLQKTCSNLVDRQITQTPGEAAPGRLGPLFAKVVDSDTIVLIELMPLEEARYSASAEADGWYNVDFALNLYELNRNEVRVPVSQVDPRLHAAFGYGSASSELNEDWNYALTNQKMFAMSPKSSRLVNGSKEAVEGFTHKLKSAHGWNFTRSMHQALYADHKEVLHVSDIARALSNCAERTTEVDARMLRTILFRTCQQPSTTQTNPTPKELEEIDMQFRRILEDFFEEVPRTEYYIFTPKDTFKSRGSDSEEDDEAMSLGAPEYEMSSEQEDSEPSTRPLDGAPPLVFLRVGCTMRGNVEERFRPIVKGKLSSVLLSSEGKEKPQVALSFIFSTITGDMGEDEQFKWTDLVKQKLRRRVKAMVSTCVLNSLRRVYPVTKTTIELVKDLFDHGSLPTKAISRVTVPLVFMDHSPLVNSVFGKEMATSPFLNVRCAKETDIYFVVQSPSSPVSATSSSAPSTSPTATAPRTSPPLPNSTAATSTRNIMPTQQKITDWRANPKYSIPYWALITLRGPSVTIEFHHPPNTPAFGLSHIMESLRNGVLRTAERVNQMTLLYQLHESRMASSLLIPPDHESDSDSDANEVLDAGHSNLGFGARRFPPGRFACPCFYRERIELPERLRAKLAMRELVGNALQQFLVSNRKNTFVYRDSHGKVYYMKLKEIDEKTLMLEVYGVDALSKEIEETLSTLLTNKVASLTLDALTSFLQRNRQFKLQPYDIRFICATQPERPIEAFSLDLPSNVTDHLLFIAYFRQNLLSFMVDLNVALPESTKRQQEASASEQHPGSWGEKSLLADATVQHPASFDTMSFVGASPAVSTAEHMGPNPLPVRVKLRQNDNALLFVSELSSFKDVGKGIALSFLNLTRTGVSGKYVAETNTVNEEGAGAKNSAAELSHRRLSSSSTHSSSTNASSTKGTSVLLSTPKTPEHIRSASLVQEDNFKEGTGFSITIESWARGQIDLGKLKEHQFEAFNQTLHEYTFEMLHVERPIQVDARGISPSIVQLSSNLEGILASSRHLSRPAQSFQAFDLRLHGLIYPSQSAALMTELNRIISVLQPQLALMNVCCRGGGMKDFMPVPITVKPSENVRVVEQPRERPHSDVKMVLGASQLTLGFEEIESEDAWLAACRYGEAGFLGENLTVISSSASGFVAPETLYHPHLDLAVRTAGSASDGPLIEASTPCWQMYEGREEDTQSNERQIVRKRNCFVMMSIRHGELLVRAYNWSLESMETLRNAIVHTIAWIALRLNLLENVLYQKLGLFFHAPVDVLSYKFCQANSGKDGSSKVSMEVLDLLKRSAVFVIQDSSHDRQRSPSQGGATSNLLSNSFQSSAEIQKDESGKYKRELKPLTVEEVLPFIQHVVPPPHYLSFLQGKGRAERARKASSVAITKPRHKSVSSHGNSAAVTAAITAGRMRSRFRPGSGDSAKKSMEAAQFQMRTRKRAGVTSSIYAESSFMFQLMGLSPRKPTVVEDSNVVEMKDVVQTHGEQLKRIAKVHNTQGKKESTVLSLVSQWRQNYHPVTASSFPFGIAASLQNRNISRVSETEINVLISLSRQFYSKSLPNILPNSSPIRLQQFRQDAVAHFVNYLEGSLDMVLVPMLKRLRASGIKQVATYLEKLVNGFLVLVEISINAQVVKCTMYTLAYESLAKESVWKRASTMKEKLVNEHEPRSPIAPQLTKIRAHLTTELNLFDINVYFLEKGLRNREYEYGEAVFRFTKFHRDRVYSSINAMEYHTGKCAIHFPMMHSDLEICAEVFHFMAANDTTFGLTALKADNQRSYSYVYKTSRDGTFKSNDTSAQGRKFSAIARAQSSSEGVLCFEFCLLFCAQDSEDNQLEGEESTVAESNADAEMVSLEEAAMQAEVQFADALSKACILYQRNTVWATLDSIRQGNGSLDAVNSSFYTTGLQALEMLSFRCHLTSLDNELNPLLSLPKECWQAKTKGLNVLDYLAKVYGKHALLSEQALAARTLILLPETPLQCHFILWIEESEAGVPRVEMCFKDKTETNVGLVEQRMFITGFIQVLSHYVLDVSV